MFCEDLVVVFSALPEVGWVSAKKCQQTHQIWEGFFSDSLYVLFIITGYNGYRLRSRSRRSYGILRLH